jgi:DNA (cytosine-5)-methyltransferase 1
MRPKSKKFDPDNNFLEPGNNQGRSFRALEWEEPSLTVAYGHREVHIHPECHRRLSMFEAMRLQKFPDSYELVGNMSQQIDMISDAVAPPVAKALADAFREQAELQSEHQMYSVTGG